MHKIGPKAIFVTMYLAIMTVQTSSMWCKRTYDCLSKCRTKFTEAIYTCLGTELSLSHKVSNLSEIRYELADPIKSQPDLYWNLRTPASSRNHTFECFGFIEAFFSRPILSKWGISQNILFLGEFTIPFFYCYFNVISNSKSWIIFTI